MPGFHGKATDFAASLGVDAKTVRRYLDTFTDLLMLRQLQPWDQNVDKQQVKAPKVNCATAVSCTGR